MDTTIVLMPGAGVYDSRIFYPWAAAGTFTVKAVEISDLEVLKITPILYYSTSDLASLCSIIDGVRSQILVSPQILVLIPTNPGSNALVEYSRFRLYRAQLTVVPGLTISAMIPLITTVTFRSDSRIALSRHLRPPAINFVTGISSGALPGEMVLQIARFSLVNDGVSIFNEYACDLVRASWYGSKVTPAYVGVPPMLRAWRLTCRALYSALPKPSDFSAYELMRYNGLSEVSVEVISRTRVPESGSSPYEMVKRPVRVQYVNGVPLYPVNTVWAMVDRINGCTTGTGSVLLVYISDEPWRPFWIRVTAVNSVARDSIRLALSELSPQRRAGMTFVGVQASFKSVLYTPYNTQFPIWPRIKRYASDGGLNIVTVISPSTYVETLAYADWDGAVMYSFTVQYLFDRGEEAMDQWSVSTQQIDLTDF